MHVFEHLGLMEVVDQHDDPVPDDIAGAKLLATGFIKRTRMVLIYEISAGRDTARFKLVESRVSQSA